MVCLALVQGLSAWNKCFSLTKQMFIEHILCGKHAVLVSGETEI